MAYDRNKNLWKLYRMLPEEYATRMFEQGGRCKCCGSQPVTSDLQVDHDHRVAKTKVKVNRKGGTFLAFAVGMNILCDGATKAEAVEAVKTELLRRSVRGLICWKCNILLRAITRHSTDRIHILQSVCTYLTDFIAALA